VDVNGTRYHLLDGEADWGRCYSASGAASLGELWTTQQPADLEWDAARHMLRLKRLPPRFRQARRVEPLDIHSRRGAGRDGYGNWYWIDADERGIRILPTSDRASVAWWSVDDLNASCIPAEDGTFAACAAPLPPDMRLRGLAVTRQHYLVAGMISPRQRGLFLFDLHTGGAPALLLWPDDVSFSPWDMAATPDGGVLVLDYDNLTYWRLDKNFRVLSDVTITETDFQPTSPNSSRNVSRVAQPRGFRLAAAITPAPGAPLSPISIEPGPDGHVLILDTPAQMRPSDPAPSRPYSIIYELDGETLVAEYSLEDAVIVSDPDVGEGSATRFSVLGHDFTYLDAYIGDPPTSQATALTRCQCSPADGDAPEAPSARPFIYIAEQDGNQVLAFELQRPPDLQGRVIAQPDFLPLRRWEAKALVATGGEIWYDFADRWVTVQVFVECHYAGRAELTTPLTFPAALSSPPAATELAEIPGRPFDGGLPGCVWHRLLIDAEIPPGTEVLIDARGADDPALLGLMGWIPQPEPYMRSDGAELPFYDPWAPRDPAAPISEWTGTWEFLFQGVTGRYLQLKLTLVGTGRSTPALRTLRAWFPRFSYAEHYLPAIYREEPGPASFMDRFLANFEGFYTTLEDKIEHSAILFDPRTAPADTLSWLACWFGLALDPLWEESRRRFFIRHADELFRRRGTVPGVEIAVRLYLDCQLTDALFSPAAWGHGQVRIVEKFRTRGIGGLVYGDTSDTAPDRQQTPIPLAQLTPSAAKASAHQFTILVSHTLTADDLAMVERIVALEKPVHTDFELKVYYAMFRVGEARLGIDTRLGNSEYFTPLRLGANRIPYSYLAAAYPFDIADRFVIGRDS
jgi:phage tail-like protein